MQLGLVTYMWGAEWDLPTLLKNCEETGFLGVELRSTHKHGVEPALDSAARLEVAQRFNDSPVELVGLGSACEYHAADPAVVRKNIEETKAFVNLCHDCGGTGVKVRPNGFPADVPMQRTIEQIGRSLNEVAAYGEGYGVQIRLEVHGHGTAELPHIKSIMDIADHPNAAVCWNANPTDLNGEGLEYNFKLVQDRLGETVHIHDLISEYPWPEFFGLLKGVDYRGWTLLEEGNPPIEPIRVMKYYRKLWELMTA
jgi:sugar phosphate isomerase/epimerase